MIRVLTLAALFLLAGRAHSHEHWINRGDYTDPVHKWRCCGDRDCYPSRSGIIKPVQGGYQLPGGEIIPAERAIPSEDQYDYTCRWGSPVNGSNVRCLFIYFPGA